MRIAQRHRVLLTHGLIGAAIGILVLHPVTRMVHWFEIDTHSIDQPGLWHFLTANLDAVFTVQMLPMTVIFALLGTVIGVFFGLFSLGIAARDEKLNFLESELAVDMATLIAQGESEHVEFKSTLRWDSDEKRANRILEGVIAKTITGFMNQRGGSLLIGVADDGEVLGLEGDYLTLRHKNRDGFERCLIDTVKTRLGADNCSFVHCVFSEFDGKDICRVIIEASPVPVYCQEGKIPKYFLRTGNGTRELNVKEALAHADLRRA